MILIKNGRVINPATNIDAVLDILVDNDTIRKIAKDITADAEIIDAQGMLVVPGLIDIHVHFREPGKNHLETIRGGAKIAARSGFTTVCTMPNTTPPVDSAELIKFTIDEGRKEGINVLPSACVTKGRSGEELAPLEELKNAGAVAFTDDGSPIMNSRVMIEALKECARLNKVLFAHEEDNSIAQKGVMNEGNVSRELGVQGIPREAEEIMIARDVLLSRLTGGHVHVQHLSSGRSVDIVRSAKAERIKITAETAPHYIALTDESVKIFGSHAKMSPSLREEHDRKAIIEGLRDGTIDVIATDHAPHSEEDKKLGLIIAPNGVIGLETALPVCMTILVRNEGFSYIDFFRLLTENPAKILGINRGSLVEGEAADIVIIDPDKKVYIDAEYILSTYKNCPFIGMNLFGEVVSTMCAGKFIYRKQTS
jgi:dihydroorotase